MTQRCTSLRARLAERGNPLPMVAELAKCGTGGSHLLISRWGTADGLDYMLIAADRAMKKHGDKYLSHHIVRFNESAGVRTRDLRIKSALLYRLSYTPKILIIKNLRYLTSFHFFSLQP
jgi:hypothetical protein